MRSRSGKRGRRNRRREASKRRTPQIRGNRPVTRESAASAPPLTAPPLEPAAPAWHALAVERVLHKLASSRSGLGESEAAARRTQHGANRFAEHHRVSAARLLFGQFANVLIVILLLAIAISAYLGREVEAIVIGVIVLFSVLLGFFQEFRAEKAVEALRELTAPTAVVVRDGVERTMSAELLVPGDLIRLASGNRVAADIRLMESWSLRADESALTGESTPVNKGAVDRIADTASLGERTNMAFAGTLITHGRALGIAVATGMDTEFGQVVRLLGKTSPRRTPLQRNLDRVGKTLALLALLIVAVICLMGAIRGGSLVDLLIFGFALAVAVVPEALPAVVTISLAIGARRMVQRNALIRRLPAVETLGCTSVICSDKTGTLTKDEMTARKLWTCQRLLTLTGTGYEPFGRLICNGEAVSPTPTEIALLQGATLASDAVLTTDETGRAGIKGDPTEGALVVAAAKAGLHRLELDSRFPRIGEIPFTSEAKRMTTLHRTEDGQTVAYSKGAVEIIVGSCSALRTAEGEQPLAEEERILILEQAHQLAAQALRVLAVATKQPATVADAEQGMTFLGLIGMIDPPRPESKGAVEHCERAGIRVVMITGDHPSTARAVASEVGILKTGRIVTGAEIDAMPLQEFDRAVGEIDVYARVSPEHKLRIVTALQNQGQVVAMTGDGVNDAPALKQADIGIAMALTGTDVSKEAAAMMLTDDNFASIVAAVEEGRGIFDNIKKYLMYLLAANIGEIGLIGFAALFGLPMPLSAVQILYVNLATDGLPALALAVDPSDKRLMHRPPRDPRSGIFTPSVVILMLAGGIWSMAVNLGLFYWANLQDRLTAEMAMTIVFVALVLTEFCKAYSFRSHDRPISRSPFSNRWLNLAILWEFALLLALVYLPPLQRWFGTFPLGGADWAMVIGSAFSIIPVLELTKWLVCRYSLQRERR